MKCQKVEAGNLWQKRFQVNCHIVTVALKPPDDGYLILRLIQKINHSIITSHHKYVTKCDGKVLKKKPIFPEKAPVLRCICTYCDEVTKIMEPFFYIIYATALYLKG